MADAQPIGRITSEQAIPTVSSGPASSDTSAAIPTLNPADSPYTPLSLPTVDPKQVVPPEQKPVQDLGATSHAGGMAYLADQVLRGAMQGYDQAQQRKADQFNKKLAAQQSIYNDQAKQLHDMAVAGVDPNSEEFKQAQNRVMTSWQATMQTIGERIPQPKKSSKSKQGQAQGADQTSLLQRVFNHKNDPQDALQAVYQGAISTGPPVLHQIAPYLTPAYRAKQQQSAQTQQSQGAAQASTADTNATTADINNKLAHAVQSGAPQGEIDKLTKQRDELTSRPTTEKSITKPDIQTLKLKNGQEVSVQWDGKKWTYLNGQDIPADLLGGEATIAPKVATSQWSQGLQSYARSHNADPNDWQTIRAYEQESYSAKNPLADRRLALAQRNSDIASANLALRKSANDWKDTQDLLKQMGPDIQINSVAQAADEYTSHPTGPGDAAFTIAFFNVLKAGAPGSGSGIRFTKQEQNLIQDARGWADAAQAKIESGFKGTLYDDNQRAQMSAIVKAAAKRSNEATANYIGAAQRINPTASEAATGGPPNARGNLPAAARSQLKEGHITTFANGQKWTLKNGQPEQVQ